MAKQKLNAVVTLRNQVSPWLMILQVVPDGWQFPDYVPGQFTSLGLPGSASRCAGEALRRISKQRWISIGVNSIAVALALFLPAVAISLYLLQTVLLLVYPLVGLRWRPGRNQQAKA